MEHYVKSIVIWGTGRRAEGLLESIKVKKSIQRHISFFVESNDSKIGSEFHNFPIKSTQIIEKLDFDEVLLIIAIADSKSICHELEDKYFLIYGADFISDLDFLKMVRRDITNNCCIAGNSARDLVKSYGFRYLDGIRSPYDDLPDETKAEIISQRNKTVGLFLYQYGGGGAERVVSKLIPIYLDMGYEVVLFTREDCDAEYELPDGVKRVRFSKTFNIVKMDDYVDEFADALEYSKIDIACFHIPYEGVELFYRLLIARMMGIRTVVVNHTSFINFVHQRGGLREHDVIYRLADRLVALSRVDQAFWSDLGCRSVYIPNPTISSSNIRAKQKESDGNTILWIGRIDNKYKKIMDVVPIMKVVHRMMPEAKLMVVGGASVDAEMETLKASIRKHGLESVIQLCGRQEDVDSYYNRADVMLMTSPGEGFPMVLSEAKAHGLPTVMYDLPYLEMVRDGKGVVTVEQGDKAAAAESLVKILKNEDLRKKLSEEAIKGAESFARYDLEGTWREVFENNYVDPAADKSAERMIVNSLLGNNI